MPASLQSLPDLNTVFSLDCFHFNDLKKVIAIILENLTDLQDKFISLNHKVVTLDIPDTSKIMALIAELEKKQFETERNHRMLSDDLDGFKMTVNSNLDELNAQVSSLEEKDNEFDARITRLEQEVEMLKKRPVAKAGADLDISMLAGREEFELLVERMIKQEKRNLEQDERLTNYEIRISKLEEMISQPMDRIIKLEQKVDNLSFQMNNKVNY
jgi:chromosome segregation ATPase